MPLPERLSRLLRLAPPSRDVPVRQDDTFLVSYPRSGSTWLRFLIANLLAPHSEGLYPALGKLVPDIYKESARGLASLPSPRHLKSHEFFDPRYPRVIYMVRDPRDVVVSYFKQQRELGLIPMTTDPSTFVDAFIMGRVDGFGTWADHVESWINTHARRRPFHLLRYEDLSTEPEGRVTEVARFLELDVDREHIASAVRAAELERMKKLENREARRADIRKYVTLIGRGEPGRWHSELGPEDSLRIAEAFGETMERVGYRVIEPDPSSEASSPPT